ncbi:hypothetical protein FRC02_000668 [Tulasnella sp. 418]|nr:hypothetical protein FRC02_000668 [Tulasnella sp. 418]
MLMTQSIPGVVSILMDMPHGTLDWWREAHPNEMSDVALSNALKAYQAIHAAGVLHNDVELRHILVTPDDEVMLIDFQMSRSTKPNRATDLWPCTQRELEAEMRKVKYLLDYKGARAREDRIWESRDEKISRRNRDLAGLRCQGTEVAQLPDEDIDPETGKYFVVDPRPGMFECKKNPATSGREFTVPPLYEYDIWRPPKEDHLPPLQPSASISSTEETLAPSATSSAGVISLAPHSEDDESELFRIQQTDHCINYKVPEAPQHLKGGDLQPPSELSPTQVSFAASTQPPNQCEQELVATATLVGPLVESAKAQQDGCDRRAGGLAL